MTAGFATTAAAPAPGESESESHAIARRVDALEKQLQALQDALTSAARYAGWDLTPPRQRHLHAVPGSRDGAS
jgi:hypothetical protein